MLLSVMFSFKYFILLSMFDAQPGLPFCIHVVTSFFKHFILKQLRIHRKLQREMYREVPCTLPPASPMLTSYTTIVQYHTEKFIWVQSIEFIQISLVCMCMYSSMQFYHIQLCITTATVKMLDSTIITRLCFYLFIATPISLFPFPNLW